ncbi:MAG: 50S ribosomal protein L18 [Patescibacteria group bacterium]
METKRTKRIRRHARVRSQIKGTPKRPRLAVFKSNRFVYAQVIDDTKGVTLLSATSQGMKGIPLKNARAVGEAIAKATLAKKIDTVVFDRGGFRYGGSIKEIADGAREGGLKF